MGANPFPTAPLSPHAGASLRRDVDNLIVIGGGAAGYTAAL